MVELMGVSCPTLNRWYSIGTLRTDRLNCPESAKDTTQLSLLVSVYIANLI